MRAHLVIAMTALVLAWAIPAQAETDWAKVDRTLSRTAVTAGPVHRYGLPRTDLKVTLDGIQLKPGFALGGWVAFEPMGQGSMMMGDLVLTEPEINPVMTKLLAEGLQVTAVHNHLLRADPPTFYMHVAGQGDPEALARLIRVALEQSKTPFDAKPPEVPSAPDPAFDSARIDTEIGAKGHTTGGVHQFSIPRSDSIRQDGAAIPGSMGTAIAINFQPTGNGKAAITGDFVALAGEVNPLVKALREGGIEVTAVHNHMLDEEPRAFFVHFWADDDAVKLAKGLRAGLAAVHAAPNP